MKTKKTQAEVYERLEGSATLVGLKSVPTRRNRQGLLEVLRHLSRRLEQGLALRLIVPKSLPASSIRAAWGKLHRPDSHVVIEDNDENTYVAYLWKGIKEANHGS